MNPENLSVSESTENVASKTQSTITLDRKEISADNDYNPFEHRTLEHKTSTGGAFFHLLKSSLGSGILAMPMAFKNIGIIPGCIGTVLVAIIATHCVHILVTTSRAVCKATKTPSLSYTDTCEMVFKIGPDKLRPFSLFVRYFVDAAMAGVCLGGTSVYVIFIASSLKDIFDYLIPENILSVEVYCCILLLPLILITQIRYLKFLVPFSIFSNICLIVTFGITCYYTFHDIPVPMKAKLVVDVSRWPLFLSTAIFAMEGINVVMPVENEMAKPEHFLGCPGVLNFTMGFVAALYGVIGLFGYLKYGDDVMGSITINLPQGEMLALAAKFLVAIAVFFTYCLQMYAPMDIIWTRLRPHVRNTYHNAAQIILRTLSVALTVVMALAVPDLGLLIGLVGAIFFSTLGILIPVTVQTVHKWKELKPFSYLLWKNGFLLLIYLIVLISGCYSAVKDIVIKYSS